MSGFNNKRVDIYAHNIKSSVTFEPNTTKLANDLFEKFFSGKLVELSEKSTEILKDLSKKIDQPPEEVLRILLEDTIFEIKEPQKPVITLSKGKKQRGKIKTKQNKNFVKNW